jgi:hypothetical protein
MRGIGSGQTIELLIVPEIAQKIRFQTAVACGMRARDRDALLQRQFQSQPLKLHAQQLKDVIAWLLINSMRSDAIQFNLLCEQNIKNIWRKESFHALRGRRAEIGHSMVCQRRDIARLLINAPLQSARTTHSDVYKCSVREWISAWRIVSQKPRLIRCKLQT